MAETKRDYYEVLGVDKGADDAAIKSAYRKLAKQYHPDLHPGDKAAEAKFKEVNEAYSVLSDAEKRAAYDRYGHAAFDPSMGGGGGGAGFGGFGGFDMGDIFSSFFGGGGASRRSARMDGEDVALRVYLSFDEAYAGVKRDVKFDRIEKCADCGGTGAEKGSKIETCSVCHGRGTVVTQRQTLLGMMQSEQTCQACRGTGKSIKNPCKNCRGSGYVKLTKTLEVSIPAGIDDGQRIVLRGQGNAGRNGGVAGDLLIEVRVRPHDLFERRGSNLFCEIPITFTDAALGAEIEVPTMTGKTKFTIPEGTQSGAEFTVKGQGMPSVSSKRKGDLIFAVTVEVPKGLNASQKKLLNEFAKSCGDGNNAKRSGFLKRFLKK
ncbi:MAG: molecular chaperone DnaJ [Clostridia bacterium]|nr:molecular chaperone DnaJ [Clostridia bacterium]